MQLPLNTSIIAVQAESSFLLKKKNNSEMKKTFIYVKIIHDLMAL
jgi:hypothetical protein